MGRLTSDHIPCKIQIGTSIRKAQIFRFENFWVEHPGFFDLVQSVWSTNVSSHNSASRITAKSNFWEQLWKKWSKGLSNLKNWIKNCNIFFGILDALEEQRTLFIQEFNFKRTLRDHTTRLLRYKKEHWKKKDTLSDGPNLVMRALAVFMLLPLKGIGTITSRQWLITVEKLPCSLRNTNKEWDVLPAPQCTMT